MKSRPYEIEIEYTLTVTRKVVYRPSDPTGIGRTDAFERAMDGFSSDVGILRKKGPADVGFVKATMTKTGALELMGGLDFVTYSDGTGTGGL